MDNPVKPQLYKNAAVLSPNQNQARFNKVFIVLKAVYTYK